MAVSFRNCLGIDIGSHSIRLAHLEMGKTGPRVVDLIQQELQIEASMNEAQRHQAIAKQLQDMLKAAKIRTRRAVFCVPGQTVFVRQFPLPKASQERMKRMVRFEARQRIPFPLDKTTIEYQFFEGENANEVNVLLVAIKREFITSFMRLVRRLGMTPVAVSVSSVALYNFHELNTTTRDLAEAAKGEGKKSAKKAKAELSGGKLSLSKKEKSVEAGEASEEGQPEDEQAPLEEVGFEEIQAYVNLGSALMDLAIPKPSVARMIGFTRSVPLAGNEMDRVIRSKLGLNSDAEARAVKERETVVLSTDFEIEGDAESVNMEASEAVTGVADRIISELRRSLDFYISQPDGVAVDSIALSGGLARLRHLRSYIEEKVGVPVSLVEPRNPQLRLPDVVRDPFCPFAVAVGLAAQGLAIAQNTINFLPADIKNVQGMQARRYEIAAMAAMLLALIFMSWDVGRGRIKEYDRVASEYEKRIAETQQEHEEIQSAKKRDERVFNAYAKLGEAAGRREFWLNFLRDFMQHRPPEILIDEMHMRLDGNVVVRGISPGANSINQFLRDLEELTKGTVEPSDDNPEGSLPVEITSLDNNVYDRRFGSRVVSFEVVMKSLVKLGRVRVIGDQPVEPTATPRPTTTRRPRRTRPRSR